MFSSNLPSTKARKTDRVLVLRPIEGKQTKSSTGLTDPRLFTGENSLHIVKDTQNNMWKFRLDAGGLPEPLKQSFTNYEKARKHAEVYYRSRNVQIKEIIE